MNRQNKKSVIDELWKLCMVKLLLNIKKLKALTWLPFKKVINSVMGI